MNFNEEINICQHSAYENNMQGALIFFWHLHRFSRKPANALSLQQAGVNAFSFI